MLVELSLLNFDKIKSKFTRQLERYKNKYGIT